jgi:hypothetical protein
MSAQATEIRRGRWAFGYEVSELPDLLSDRSRLEGAIEPLETEWIARHQALLETMCTMARGTAIQLRYTRFAAVDAGLRLVLLGAADSDLTAARLSTAVASVLPIEVRLRPLAIADVVELTARAPNQLDIAEVRRRLTSLDPLEERSGTPATPVVLPFEGTGPAHALAARMLAEQHEGTEFAVTASMDEPSAELLSQMDAVLSEVERSNSIEHALASRMIATYRHRLRELSRASLRVRMTVSAPDRLGPGLVEAVAVQFGGEAGFEIFRPRSNQERGLAAVALQALVLGNWRSDEPRYLHDLRELSSVQETSRVLHVPLAPQGGITELPAARVSFLPRSTERAVQGLASVTLGTQLSGSRAELAVQDVRQHLLVAGLPGFGKTSTVHTLLEGLFDQGVPFLVIDPAKSDYAQLVQRINDKKGPGTARRVVLDPRVPAFNPFAVPMGSSASAHAGRVLAAFDAALSLSGTWPAGYITFGRAVFSAFEKGTPTMRSLYATLGDVIRRSGFTGVDGANLRASLLGRLEFMCRGPLGDALTMGPESGIDWAELLSAPTVIELKGFAGPTERSLVFALLLAGLISFREANPAAVGLEHVTVLEEAHRILGDHGESTAEGVRLFIESMAELRGSGEGFVVVDQAPTSLHAGVMKLTSTVLTHRLVDAGERAAVGGALLLDERQQVDLARLAIGEAVLFSPSRTSPVVLRVTPPVGAREAPRGNATLASGGTDPVFCIGCAQMCRHREIGHSLAGARQWSGSTPQLLAELAVLGNAGIHEVRCAAAHVISRGRSSAEMFALLAEMDDFIQHRPSRKASTDDR